MAPIRFRPAASRVVAIRPVWAACRVTAPTRFRPAAFPEPVILVRRVVFRVTALVPAAWEVFPVMARIRSRLAAFPVVPVVLAVLAAAVLAARARSVRISSAIRPATARLSAPTE